MESNTQRMERLLVLWLELHRAVRRAWAAGVDRERIGAGPWESRDANVTDAWRKLTAPGNCGLLEQWLHQSADGQPAEWAREALRSCRERMIRNGEGEMK